MSRTYLHAQTYATMCLCTLIISFVCPCEFMWVNYRKFCLIHKKSKELGDVWKRNLVLCSIKFFVSHFLPCWSSRDPSNLSCGPMGASTPPSWNPQDYYYYSHRRWILITLAIPDFSSTATTSGEVYFLDSTGQVCSEVFFNALDQALH